jgi:hypothetical protein
MIQRPFDSKRIYDLLEARPLTLIPVSQRPGPGDDAMVVGSLKWAA